jgi:predicted MFS family arabinose efflux permease
MNKSYDRSVKNARRATLLSFLVCGIAVSAWAPMVPLAKERTGLNEAGLGLILLCMGGGAIVTMPFIGPLIQRTGSRPVIVAGSLLTALVLPILTLAATPVALGATLLVFGAALGSLDVAMNAQAVVVQEKVNRPVMSSFHGMFSLGGLTGSMLFGVLLWLKLTPFIAAIVLASALIVVALVHYKSFLDHPPKENEPSFSFRFPKGPVVILGLFCFIFFLYEGALLDWSALLLKEDRGVSDAMAGSGYAVFSVAMALMRFTGDGLVHRFGPKKIVVWGTVLTVAGLAMIVATPWLATNMVGFLMIGVGAANVVPVLFSAAGKADATSPELALAAVTTMGYAGQLAGPALIGFAAHLTSLPVALGLLGAPLILVALGFRPKSF